MTSDAFANLYGTRRARAGRPAICIINGLGAREVRVTVCRVLQIKSQSISALKECDSNLYPNLSVLLRIACTLPVTSCECECNASVVRRLHNFMLTESRFTSLALMHIHYQHHVVVQMFAELHPRRLQLTSIVFDFCTTSNILLIFDIIYSEKVVIIINGVVVTDSAYITPQNSRLATGLYYLFLIRRIFHLLVSSPFFTQL